MDFCGRTQFIIRRSFFPIVKQRQNDPRRLSRMRTENVVWHCLGGDYSDTAPSLANTLACGERSNQLYSPKPKSVPGRFAEDGESQNCIESSWGI